MLASFFNLGSFSYTSHGFIFIWGTSLKHPMLASVLFGEFLLHIPCWLPFIFREFLLHIPCWVYFLSGEFLLHVPCWFYFSVVSFSYTSHVLVSFFNLGSFSYTSRAGFIFISGVCLTYFVLASFSYLGSFSYTSPAFFFFFFFFFFLNYRGNFSYTYRAVFTFILGVSLTHPVLASFLSGEFLLHIPCWLFLSVGSFSYTSHAGFFFTFFSFLFIWGVSLTRPVLASFFYGEFLLHIPCCLSFSFFCGEFLLQIPCWLYFYLGSFSYTSDASFIFIWGVSLTHPMLAF